MRGQRWWSLALGAILAGLVWELIPGPGGETEKSVAPRDEKTLSTRKVAAARIKHGVFDRMEIVKSTQIKDFEELVSSLRRWENGQLEGRAWSFSDQVALARMTEMNPKRAWVWLDENLIGTDDLTKERKEMIELEWAFQDYEGLVSFLSSRNPTKAVTDLVSLEALELGPPARWVRHFQEVQMGQFSTGSETRFVSSLKGGRACREVLRTWRDTPAEVQHDWEKRIAEAESAWKRNLMKKWMNPSSNALVQKTIQRWREVDEAGFLASEFVEWETD